MNILRHLVIRNKIEDKKFKLESRSKRLFSSDVPFVKGMGSL